MLLRIVLYHHYDIIGYLQDQVIDFKGSVLFIRGSFYNLVYFYLLVIS